MIIKETKVGEGNKIFTLITSDHGKIQASGAGVRSFKSKLSSGCGLFCYSDFILKKGKSKEIYNIVSADKITDFFNIRYDIEKLATVNYLCELANHITLPETDCGEILRLLLNTVYYVDKNPLSKKIKPVFEIRLMCESGFTPNLTSCQKCGSVENLCYFSVDGGTAECKECKKIANISEGALQAMKYISTAPLKNIFSFDANETILHELTGFAEQYVLHQIGTVPKSLIYLKSM